MPQIIEVPGHGDVEFPDDMDDTAIAAAIKKNLLGGSRTDLNSPSMRAAARISGQSTNTPPPEPYHYDEGEGFDAGGLGPLGRGMAKQPKKTAGALLEMAPAGAAMAAAPFTGGMSLPMALGTVGILSGGGEAVNQLGHHILGFDAPQSSAEAAKRIATEGAIQAAFEGGGRLIGAGLRAGGKKLLDLSTRRAKPLIDAEVKAAEKEAAEALKAKAAAAKSSFLGEEAAVQTATSDARAAERAAVQNQLDTLQSEADQIASSVAAKRAPEVGTSAQAAVKKGAKLSAQAGEKLYDQAAAAFGADTINIAPLKQEMARLFEQQSIESLGQPAAVDLAKAVNAGDRKILSIAQKPNTLQFNLAEGEAPAARSFFGDPTFAGFNAKVSQLPDEVSFEEARQLQKWIGLHLPGNPLSANAPKSLFKHLWGTMADTMEQGMAHNPEAAALLKDANSHWASHSNVFKRGVVPQLAKAYPEDFVKKIPISGVSRMKAVKSAILDQAMQFGTPEEKAAAQEAWGAVQGEFIRSRLMEGGVTKLGSNLAKAEAILGELPPDKITALRNITAAVKAAEEVTPLERYQARAFSQAPPSPITPLEPGSIVPDYSIANVDRVLKQNASGFSGKGVTPAVTAAMMSHWMHIPNLDKVAAAYLAGKGLSAIVEWGVQNPARSQMVAQAIREYGRIGGRALGPVVAAWAADLKNGAISPAGLPPSPPSFGAQIP